MLFSVCLLCDTHGVLALADQGLPVIVPLGPDRDQLQGVGSGTELPIGWLHPPAGRVSQVYAAQWLLVTRNKPQKTIDYIYNRHHVTWPCDVSVVQRSREL